MSQNWWEAAPLADEVAPAKAAQASNWWESAPLADESDVAADQEPQGLLSRAGSWLNDMRRQMQDDANANQVPGEAEQLATVSESNANAATANIQRAAEKPLPEPAFKLDMDVPTSAKSQTDLANIGEYIMANRDQPETVGESLRKNGITDDVIKSVLPMVDKSHQYRMGEAAQRYYDDKGFLPDRTENAAKRLRAQGFNEKEIGAIHESILSNLKANGIDLASLDRERSLAEVGGDTGRQVVQGAARMAAGLTWVADRVISGTDAGKGLLGGATKWLDRAGASMEAGKTDTTRANVFATHEGSDGFMGTVQGLVTNPTALADLAFSNVAMVVPGVVATRIASGARYAQVLSATGDASKAAAAASTAAQAAGLAMTGIMEGSDAGKQVWDSTLKMPLARLAEESHAFKSMVASGVSPEDARREVAHKASALAFASQAALAMGASQATGANRFQTNIFTGKSLREAFETGGAGGIVGGVLKTGARESVEETIHEGGNQANVNFATKEFLDPNQDLREGVAESAAMGAVLGPAVAGGYGAMGAVTSGMSRDQRMQDQFVADIDAMRFYEPALDQTAVDRLAPNRAQITEVAGAPIESVFDAPTVDDAIAAAESASGTVIPPMPAPAPAPVPLDLARRQDELLAALEQPQQDDMQALLEQATLAGATAEEAQRPITDRTPAELQMMARHHASPEVREQATAEIARREAAAQPAQRVRPTAGQGYGRPMESGQPIEQAPTAMEQALRRAGVAPEQFAKDAQASRERAAAQKAVPTEDQRLTEKRAIYEANKESGAPDDVAAQIMLRWQEKANKEASPQNVWRSKNGALGVVPATAQSPFVSGELVGTLYPEAKPDVEPVAEQSEQEVALPTAADELILQNRNRATPSSVAQMQSIASAPDYGRLGYSRDFANGAPVVAGGLIPAAQMGRKDFAVAADGRRIPVQYAVVEAGSLLPSNRADGTPNADYGDQYKTAIRAIAGNGRVAGLQLAHQNGATAEYLNEMTGDMLHGVNPNTIRKLRNPVLVRVMPVDQVTADIGDVSNTAGSLSLSAVEQARNDVQRVSLDALQFAEDGNVTAETVRQFVRAMPQAEQGGLIDTNGQPTRQAVDRLNAAVFAGAYGNDGLVRLYAQAQDPEARIVMSALAQVAPKMARLEGAGALDIREVVTQAAEIAVNARREGMSIARAAQQLDLAADPLVGVVLDLFAANSRSSRNVADALGRIADLAYTEATKPDADMFGPVPRASRSDVINQLSPQDEQRSQEALEQPTGREPVPVDAVRSDANPGKAADPAAVEASRPAEDEGSQEGLTLESYTPAELAQREAEQQARDEAEAKTNREADEKARKDNERAEVRRRSEAAADTFELGQSADDNLSGQGGLQFSRSSPFKPDPYDAQQYAQAVDRIAAMGVAPRTDLTVGDTPAVLRALGAQSLPIQMPSSMIHKASRPEVKDHNVPVEVLRQIPALLADPVMVFDSQTESGALVVLVDANDASGRPVVVAIHLEAKGGGFNRINRIASIYGKDNAAEIGRWMQGSLRYHHKQKAPGWLRAVGLQLPEANTIKSLNPRVLTNEDVVNLRYSFAGQSPALETIKSEWREAGISAAVSERDGVVTVSKIVVPEANRGQGVGTRAMQQLIDYADANGLHVALTPSSDFGGNKARLGDFYKRFGFVENKGRNRVFSVSESMVRENPNGRPLYSASGSSNDRPGITRNTLIEAIANSHPSLSNAVGRMLERGDNAQKGGLVVIESANELDIAEVFASKTGRDIDEVLDALQMSVADSDLRIEVQARGSNAPVLVNDSPDIVQIPMDVQNRTRGRFLAKPVRLLNGRHFGKNRGYGVAHIEAEHGRDSPDTVRHVVQMVRNATKIYDDGSGRLMLQAVGAQKGVAIIELRDEGEFYSIVTAFDGSPRGKLVWSGRRLHLSTMGSGDAGSSAITTAEQSVSPSARTARGNEAEATPNPVLEALADQTSDASIAQINPEVKFSASGAINGFFDPRSGITFMVGPNLTAETAPGVLLHEATHGKQRAGLDAQAQTLLGQTEDKRHPQKTRDFLVRVNERIEAAGETGNASEAAAYIVELAAIEGRQAGFSAIDGKFMDWVDNTLGKRIGNFVRDFVAMIRSWGLRNGVELSQVAVDDLVAIAKSNVKAMARGDVGASGSSGPQFSRGGPPSGPGSLAQGGGRPAPRLSTLPAETKARAVQRTLQDDMNRFTVVQDWLQENGVGINVKNDVWGAEVRMHGIIAVQIEEFRERRVKPLVKRTQQAKIDTDAMTAWLVAEHAEERNAQIRSIDATNDAGSGMTDQQAKDMMAGRKVTYNGTEYQFDAEQRAAAKELAKDWRKIAEDAKQMRLNAGLLDADMVKAWEGAYKKYVPLKGGDDSGAQGGTGQRLSAKVRNQRAMGHDAREEKVIENLIRDYEMAVHQVEKNKVAHVALKLVLDANNAEIGTVDKPAKRKVLKPGDVAWTVQNANGLTLASFDNQQDARRYIVANNITGAVPQRVQANPSVAYQASSMLAENEFQAYVLGHAIRVQLNDPLLARAYNRIGIDGLNGILRIGRTMNGYLSKVYTGLNPEFLYANVQRDLMFGVIKMTADYGIGAAMSNVAKWPTSFMQVLRYRVGGAGSNDLRQYMASGGTTGVGLVSDIERIGSDVQLAFDQYRGAMETYRAEGGAKGAMRAAQVATWKLVRGLTDWIEHLNAAGENAMRLATFRTVRDMTGDVAKAVIAAKMITTNFNKRGESGPTISAMYLFYNPAVQGTAAFAEGMFYGKHKGQAWAILGTLVALGVMMRMQWDDDEWEKLNVSDKTRNWLIRTGQDSYVKVPHAYGPGFFPLLGQELYNLDRGQTETDVAAIRIASAFIEHFGPAVNPIGAKENTRWADVAFSISPTVPQIAFAPALNMNDFGGELVPDSIFDEGKPDSQRMFRSTKGTVYADFAEWLNTGTGGTKSQKGALDVSPETLKHVVTSLTGGAGAFTADTFSLAKNYLTGELDPNSTTIKDLPFVRKTFGKQDIRDLRRPYYDLRMEADKAKGDYKRAIKSQEFDVAEKLWDKNGPMIALTKMLDAYGKQIKMIRDQQDVIMLNDDLKLSEKRMKVKELEDMEAEVYQTVDRQVKEFKDSF